MAQNVKILICFQKKDTSLFQRGASSLKQRRVFFRFQNRVLLGIFDFESVFLKPQVVSSSALSSFFET